MIYIILLGYISIDLCLSIICLIVFQHLYKKSYRLNIKHNEDKKQECLDALNYIKEHYTKVYKDIKKSNECFDKLENFIKEIDNEEV